MADRKIAMACPKLQSNPKRPGGSKQGIRAKRDMNVIGVVLHINLNKQETLITIQKRQDVHIKSLDP
jgi:hypothetical protein